MATSVYERIADAVTAQDQEVESLSRYLDAYQRERSFSKVPSTGGDNLHSGGLASAGERNTAYASRRSPFHHLQAEFSFLLGISGGRLVCKIWERFHLDLTESRPHILKPAILKLFSTAARIAAPRGSSRALRTLLKAFEAEYFLTEETSKTPVDPSHEQRFTLLAMISTGQGAQLLSSVLASSRNGIYRTEPSTPSSKAGGDRARLRREFLFEVSCRSMNWAEAYKQARAMNLSKPADGMGRSLEGRFREVYRRQLCEALHPSKKKQLLSDLAGGLVECPDTRKEYTLQAFSLPARSTRPGAQEALLLDLLSPDDPRWMVALSRLYRYRPMPERWMNSFRKIWQSKRRSRTYIQVLFSIMRLPRRRALATLYEQEGRFTLHQPPASLTRARLERVKTEVKSWKAILSPRSPYQGRVFDGPVVNLRAGLWRHIVQVCNLLEESVPCRIRVGSDIANVWVRQHDGEKEIVIHPTLLSLSDGESRFLLAAALYRHATGLDTLAAPGEGLGEMMGVQQAAILYTQWQRYPEELLLGIEDATDLEFADLQPVLEELYWKTDDPMYLRLCEVLTSGCWCPRGEVEADLFAAGFCHLLDASYAITNSGLACLPLYRSCESGGLRALIPQLKHHRALTLRLQNLWMSGHEQFQMDRITR